MLSIKKASGPSPGEVSICLRLRQGQHRVCRGHCCRGFSLVPSDIMIIWNLCSPEKRIIQPEFLKLWKMKNKNGWNIVNRYTDSLFAFDAGLHFLKISQAQMWTILPDSFWKDNVAIGRRSGRGGGDEPAAGPTFTQQGSQTLVEGVHRCQRKIYT